MFFFVLEIEDFVKVLLEKGIFVDRVDSFGRILLCNVVFNGSVDVVRFFIKYGVNVNFLDIFG